MEDNTSNEPNLDDFVAFLKEKGFDLKPLPSSNAWAPGYKLNINGYRVAIKLDSTTIWRNWEPSSGYVVLYAPLNSTGYMRETRKTSEEFSSTEKYYEYAFEELLDFANKKLDTINDSRQRKQKIKEQVNNLKNGDKLELTLQELQDLLKSKPMSLTTKVTIQLT